MTAEEDIAAVDTGGGNTASEVRTALTSVLHAGMRLHQEITLDAPSPTIEFTSIPATGRHLVFVGSLRSSRAVNYDRIQMRVGDGTLDTTASYSHAIQKFFPSLGSVNSYQGSFTCDLGILPGANAVAGAFGNFHATFFDYAATDRFKRVRTHTEGHGFNGGQFMEIAVGQWLNVASPINIISFQVPAAADFVAGSKMSLYLVG